MTQPAATPITTQTDAGAPVTLPGHLAGAFFASGAAALIYELLWFRLLGHVFGSTATATATLLAAYLFGLGIGAWLFGRWSDRIASHPRAYIAIELGIGLYGVASHFFLSRGAALYAMGHSWAGDDGGKLLLARFLVSFLLIAIPTTLMGGTFPLMVQILKARGRSLGRATGEAYAANTAGAAAGVLALPFLLLPSLGVTRSLIVAALANFVAAALVFDFTRARPRDDRDLDLAEDESAPSPPGIVPVSAPPVPAAHAGLVDAGARRWVLAGFFLSSFASLALETVWTRHFGIFFGAQIYNFAFILFGYLLGLFLGGAIFAHRVERGANPGRLLFIGLALAGAPVALTLPFLDRLPIPQIRMMMAMGVSHSSFLATTAIETIAFVLPTAIGFGLVFPAVVALVAGRDSRTGASIALTYVVNTAGTTLGAIIGGFVLIPAVGTQRTLEISAALIAVALILSSRAAWAPQSALVRWGLPAAFAATLFLPPWNWKLAHGTYAKDPLTFVNVVRSGSLDAQLAREKVLYMNEGVEATVGVAQFDSSRYSALFINGKPDASSYPADMVIQRLLAVIPGLFHDGPERALVIGLGSGTTLGTLRRWPIEKIDAAEISPEVADAATRYFGDVNDAFLSDPRVTLHLDDGRNFLHFQPPGTYDLIISAPSNPWLAGISALFTDEFFREAAERLRPGGLICQWSGYYNLSMDHIRMVVRTFRRHFPETAIFVARGDQPTGDFLLIGSNQPLRMRHRPDDPAIPEAVRAALADIGNDGPTQILSGLVVSPDNAAAFAGDGEFNSDDRPILELEAPGDRFRPWFTENLVAFLTASRRNFIAMGPPPGVSPAATELAHDGVVVAPAAADGGKELRRGAYVFTTQAKGEEDLRRYVLVGRDIENGGAVTAIYRTIEPPSGPAELLEIARTVAGGEAGALRDAEVNGHRALTLLAQEGNERIAVVSWFCDVLGRAFFVGLRGTAQTLPSADAAVASLLNEYSCDHHGIAVADVAAEVARARAAGLAAGMSPWIPGAPPATSPTTSGRPTTSGNPGSSAVR